MKRRLTTILCADVQGYSAMMEADEAATLSTLNRYRSAMEGLFARHDGRKVNTWGDAVIAEFPSAVGAVQCAVEIQDELAAENRSMPDGEQMWFRIGINLGDVMIDGDDLYGDGVNVAARLQSMAKPGGILISDAVFQQVRRKLAVGFDYIGEQRVKNIDEPVKSYSVRVGGDNRPEFDPGPDLSEPEASPRPQPEALRPQPEPESGHSEPVFNSDVAEAGVRRVWSWLKRQPRRVQLSACWIGFFFTLNILTNPFEIWFHWPSLPAIFIIVFQLMRSRSEHKPR